MAAGLAAKAANLSYVVLEQGDIGGAILHYPRAKVVMTSPVELPLWGKLKLTDVKKEALIDVWKDVISKTGLDVRTNEKVVEVETTGEQFILATTTLRISARYVLLALGRRGTPRKLGVPGEELSKVMYRLIDTSTYNDSHTLIVGGGDSAVEAAIGLSLQKNNTITLSYRRGEFSRLKERNLQHIGDLIARKKVRVIFNSEVKEISETTATLSMPEGETTLQNEFVFIFAGGELPYELLKKIGVSTRMQEINEPATT